MKKYLALLGLAVFALVGCTTPSAYETGVNAQVAGNSQFQNTQNEQLNTIQMCYIYSKDSSQCSILAAGAIPTQVLGGRPTPIRIAKSTGEILESLATTGFDAAVKIYGLKAVSDVINNATAEAGKVEIVRPDVVRPEIVQPVIVTVPGG